MEMFLHPDRDHLESYRPLHPPIQGRYILRALRNPQGRMIGNLDLFQVAEEGRWEIAYDLDPEWWGLGLGGMMVGFLVNWGGAIGVKVISAVCPAYFLSFIQQPSSSPPYCPPIGLCQRLSKISLVESDHTPSFIHLTTRD